MKTEKKTSKANFYFTEEDEQNIVLFNQATTQQERDEIWAKLSPAFYKLAEYNFNCHKFDYIIQSFPEKESAIDAAVAHCVKNCKTFNPVKGKAFSYFNLTIRNFFIALNDYHYKTNAIECFRLDATLRGDNSGRTAANSDRDRDSISNTMDFAVEETGLDYKEFLSLAADYFETKFDRHNLLMPSHQPVFDAIITLMRDTDSCVMMKRQILNKIKQLTGHKKITTQKVTNVLKRMKPAMQKMLRHYIETGEVDYLSES